MKKVSKSIQIIALKKNPKIKKEQTKGKWLASVDRWDVDIVSKGKTEKEAQNNLWNKMYELIPVLESNVEKLEYPARKQLEFLREHFQYTLVDK